MIKVELSFLFICLRQLYSVVEGGQLQRNGEIQVLSDNPLLTAVCRIVITYCDFIHKASPFRNPSADADRLKIAKSGAVSDMKMSFLHR